MKNRKQFFLTAEEMCAACDVEQNAVRLPSPTNGICCRPGRVMPTPAGKSRKRLAVAFAVCRMQFKQGTKRHGVRHQLPMLDTLGLSSPVADRYPQTSCAGSGKSPRPFRYLGVPLHKIAVEPLDRPERQPERSDPSFSLHWDTVRTKQEHHIAPFSFRWRVESGSYFPLLLARNGSSLR